MGKPSLRAWCWAFIVAIPAILFDLATQPETQHFPWVLALVAGVGVAIYVLACIANQVFSQ